MDKYEYKIRSEEIKNLVASKKYEDAMKIADTIDWRRVKSIMMLTIVSDIYKVNRRYEDSKAVLLLAYDRHPGGRTIVYSLCELSIKMEEFVEAWEYYKEFVQIAPKDTGRFILQYKIYEAQEVGIEERIAVLEEFKKRDYREKWAYELAYLYHRIGLSTKCIEECDELVLWFGEGKYVLKAMELKMLHEPLNPMQQNKYDQLTGNKATGTIQMEEEEDSDIEEDNTEQEETEEFMEPDMDVHVKPMDMSKYNTINLQKELAASMKELLSDNLDNEEEEPTDRVAKAIVAPLLEETGSLPNLENNEKIENIEMKPFQQEIQEVFFEEGKTEELPEVEELEEVADNSNLEETKEYAKIVDNKKIVPFEVAEILGSAKNTEDEVEELEEIQENDETEVSIEKEHREKTPEEIEYERMVAQDYDGQITLVVPEAEQIEKQITGQMNIQDILTEWENMKKENQEKRMEDVRKRVSEQTGQLFSEFDEATKTDLLAKLEAASKLEEENRVLKEAALAEKNIDEKLEIEMPEMPEMEEAEEINEEILAEEDAVEQEEVAELEKMDGVPAEDINNEDAAEKETDNTEVEDKTRILTEEEEKLFGSVLHSKRAKRELIQALDMVSLASYTGNIIITGEEGTGTIEFAKNLMKDIQTMDSNFSGKVAKISAKTINSKNPAKIFSKLENGALIIEKAGSLSTDAVDKILKVLDQSTKGIVILIEDTPKNIDKLIQSNKDVEKVFNARINVPQLNNDALVEYAKQYAMEEEFSIDELGILALYTRIAELQTSDHVANVEDIEDIMEDAIYHATKKSVSHFKDVLFGKRYDDDDMIVLREKDFINY